MATRNRPVTADMVTRALKMRDAGIYTWRDIADQLEVNREKLLDAVEEAIRADREAENAI